MKDLTPWYEAIDRWLWRGWPAKMIVKHVGNCYRILKREEREMLMAYVAVAQHGRPKRRRQTGPALKAIDHSHWAGDGDDGMRFLCLSCRTLHGSMGKFCAECGVKFARIIPPDPMRERHFPKEQDPDRWWVIEQLTINYLQNGWQPIAMLPSDVNAIDAHRALTAFRLSEYRQALECVILPALYRVRRGPRPLRLAQYSCSHLTVGNQLDEILYELSDATLEDIVEVEEQLAKVGLTPAMVVNGPEAGRKELYDVDCPES